MGVAQSLRGKRFSISGSAGGSGTQPVELSLLQRCHSFVYHLTLGILRAGGDIVAFIGDEPMLEPGDTKTGKVFYWTELEAIAAYIQEQGQTHSDRTLLHAIVAVEKPDSGIPKSRQSLWHKLLAAEAVKLVPIPNRDNVGGHQRERQAEVADILIALGGGRGVHDLARHFRKRGALVLGLDARIGASCDDGEAALALNREALCHPERFVPSAVAHWFQHQLPLLSFESSTPPEDMAHRVLALLERLIRAPGALAPTGQAPRLSPPSSAAAAVIPEARQLDQPLHFLVLADEWQPQKGGLSTFNRELCLGLARAGHSVSVFVPRSAGTKAELELFKKDSGIRFVHSQRVPLQDDPELFLKPALTTPPDVIIGHGQITGRHARMQRIEHFPDSLLVHFVHAAPQEIEHLKDKAPAAAMRDAETKDQKQAQLAGEADLVCAVGPQLKLSIEQSMHSWKKHAPVFEFLPWLPMHELVPVPPQRAALWIGRTDAAHLKGLDLAVRALARLPEPVPILYIRGVETQDAEALRGKIRSWSEGKVEGRPLEFTPDEQRIDSSFRGATVVLMPSRSEGFGLVGLEAIARGIPVLVSSKSGLAQLLERDGGAHGKAAIVLISPNDDENVERLYQKLQPIWYSPETAFDQARELRERLQSRLDEHLLISHFIEELRQKLSERSAAQDRR